MNHEDCELSGNADRKFKCEGYILRVALPVPINHYFDYLAPTDFVNIALKKGLRVLVPFGRRQKIGFLVEVSETSSFPSSRLKTALAVLDKEPLLPDSLLHLLEWTSRYYHYPFGEVFANALPPLLRKQRKGNNLTVAEISSIKSSDDNEMAAPTVALNMQQQAAVDTVTQSLGTFKPFLLHGVTGSGKTEVYLEVIAATLYRKEQVLVLVPEIGLTPQMLARFQNRFSVPLVLFHSGLTDKQRLKHWLLAKTGHASIIMGTRSALFTPLLHPGLIIIDEEHDSSFKQQKGLRYHARDLALMRAKLENIPIILGSATASLESIANARQKRYHFLSLPNRAGNAVQPHLRFIDLRHQKLDQGFSPVLLQSMEQHLKNQGQVLLFLNRRGFAPLTICHACGWTADCPHCDQKMTFHKAPMHLQCHYCSYRCPLASRCPACQEDQLVVIGQGTQRLEATLKKYFPEVGIARLDRDNTRRKGSLEDLLKNIHQGESQILIGTQMLAKGHHFPNVTLVGILETDAGLFSADFRALERTGQLVMQVAGRAGRADKPGEVLIQTHHPEHPSLMHLINEGYLSFSKKLLVERRLSMLPPYTHLALVLAEAISSSYPLNFLNEIKQCANQLQKNVAVLGPIPALSPRRAGYYRAQLLFQATKRNDLHNLLKSLTKLIPGLSNRRRVRWSLDVDPLEII
ncbi:MAG: primosomal protein N' [Pseudomonadota bacterium]